MRKLYYITLAVICLLGVALSVWAHPGVGGCKSDDQGGIEVASDCTVTVKAFKSMAIGIRQQNLAIFGTGNACLSFVTGNAATCGVPGSFASMPVLLNGAAVIKSVLCSYQKSTAFDASDTCTFKVAEATGSAAAFFGTGFTINSGSAAAGTLSETINASTTLTPPYGLTIASTTCDDTTAGAEALSLSCIIDYELQ